MKIYNSHSHFGVEIDRGKMSLKYLFNKSYVGWQNELKSESQEDIKAYFDKNIHMKAFFQLKKTLEKLYGEGLTLNEKTWHTFDERLKSAYNNLGYENNLLRNICGYEKILLDDYIKIRSDGSNGVICDVALRCDFMFYGYSYESLMSSEAEPFEFFEEIPDNIEDYTRKIKEYIKESYEKGKCTAIKVCMAYFRDIAFRESKKDKAQLVYKEPKNQLYVKYFQDYVMDQICLIAEEFNIPIQMHTGLGQIYGTSPINILSLVKRHEKNNFALLHGGFPWTDDLLAVLYDSPNTYLDVCWMPILSSKISLNTLINTLELIGSDRILWGCDTAIAEESYGSLLASLEILDEVEEHFISKGVFKKEDNQNLKEKILYKNAVKLFGNSN